MNFFLLLVFPRFFSSRTGGNPKIPFLAEQYRVFLPNHYFVFPNDFLQDCRILLGPFGLQNFGRGCAGWIGGRAAHPAGVFAHP